VAARIATLVAALAISALARSSFAQDPSADAAIEASFGDRTYFKTLDEKVRIGVNEPLTDAEGRTNRLIIYATPNGNTIEQTLGCTMKPGLDWHYDIQHIAAQVRLLRELTRDERLVLVCTEAAGLSWPTWCGSRPDDNARIARFLDDWRTAYGGAGARVTLTGHSGGGSFIFGVIEGGDEIPAYIDRIAILDANYAFDDAKHTAKLVRWLEEDASRRLIVLAYDDRNIELNGNKVVGPDGGTFRATQRMVAGFKPHFEITETQSDPFTEYFGLDGRVRFYVHRNPQNKILHTALVGEMNGLIQAQTLGTPQEGEWGAFGGPRAYEKWIDAPVATIVATGASAEEEAMPIPPRPADAPAGRAFMQQISSLDRHQREAAVLQEMLRGNIPDLLRSLKRVPITAGEVQAVMQVMPDYLAIGTNEDFVRIPMTPQTAQRIADKFGFTLPTRKMVDAIDAASEVKLPPQPLTEDRESVAAFLLSNGKIEQQRAGKPLGALTTGAKKDIVLTPEIHERPDRVAIYGWRQPDGKVIQPLTTVHINWYVDYSHGVRLVFDALHMDGKPGSRISELLADPQHCAMFSDEGPIAPPRYLPASK
jgi:pimeloyl-ACP methyl ester carboxylesterase